MPILAYSHDLLDGMCDIYEKLGVMHFQELARLIKSDGRAFIQVSELECLDTRVSEKMCVQMKPPTSKRKKIYFISRKTVKQRQEWLRNRGSEEETLYPMGSTPEEVKSCRTEMHAVLVRGPCSARKQLGHGPQDRLKSSR